MLDDGCRRMKPSYKSYSAFSLVLLRGCVIFKVSAMVYIVCGFTNINCQSKATCDSKADFNSWSTENTIGLKATSSTCLSQCRLWEVHCLAALLMLSFYILTASTAFFIKYIYRPYPFFWIFIFYSFCPHLKGFITRLNRFFKKIFKF